MRLQGGNVPPEIYVQTLNYEKHPNEGIAD